ncbi:MAG: aminotransferase, partial [Candidatus Nanopelagicales bacterium]
LRDRVEALVVERERVLQGLREAGVEVTTSEANFVWLPLGADSEAFAARTEAAGLTVRTFPTEGVRITIAEPTANTRLLALLTHP